MTRYHEAREALAKYLFSVHKPNPSWDWKESKWNREFRQLCLFEADALLSRLDPQGMPYLTVLSEDQGLPTVLELSTARSDEYAAGWQQAIWSMFDRGFRVVLPSSLPEEQP